MPIIIKHAVAQNDLFEIGDYIARDSLTRAEKFADDLEQKFQILARKPVIGRLRDEFGKNLRSFPFGRYIIFYTAIKNGVEIVRVLHSARDLATLFHSDENS